MRPAAALAAVVGAAAAAGAAAFTPWQDSSLNVTQIAYSLPESNHVYLGSPSIVRLASGSLVASHDFFGNTTATHTAVAYRSTDGGSTWVQAGAAQPMYWATLFTRPGDASVYLLGVSGDGSAGVAQIVISASADEGVTWSPSVALTNSNVSYSTGPTPVMNYGGRLWRAHEHNTGAGWGRGYASVVISVPATAASLLEPSAWSLSGELPFASVAGSVPASWTVSGVQPSFGWLEGGVVPPVNASSAGVNVVLRVNSQPAANKAALLTLASPTGALEFTAWIDPFPGGMSKFTIRRDVCGSNATGLYVTLSNNIVDDGVTLPPTCGPVSPPLANATLPCCGFLEACYTGPKPTCYWCKAGSRQNLTLAVSPDLLNWRVVTTVLFDDTGLPAFISEMSTGFQYVDFQLDSGTGSADCDGPTGGADIVAAVRAGYRGSNNYHNSNRLLFKAVPSWRTLL